MKRIAIVTSSAVAAAGVFAAWALRAADSPRTLGGSQPVYSPYPAALLPADLPSELRRVAGEVDIVEQRAIAQWHGLEIRPGTLLQQVQTLGKLELYDRNLSVNRNLACASCHMPYTGFTGPISSVNATIANYPGSVPYRIDARRPQPYTYAPYSPVLHYDAALDQFFGGNYWDLRATGALPQNPSVTQAEFPPVDPDELGFPDTACVVYRLSQAAYRPLFETVWGSDAFQIRWPANIEDLCAAPGSGSPSAALAEPDRQPLPLTPPDRQHANNAYSNFARAIAAQEYSLEESAFSSKFDDAVAHPDRKILTDDEFAGWGLFNGKARCNLCHADGTAGGAGAVPLRNLPVAQPLFTDWSSENLGLPRNPSNPFYYENKPDPYGHVPNGDGASFRDLGLSAFLESQDGKVNPDKRWASAAAGHVGEFQTSTVRNADMRPCAGFVKAYFHNGYIKSLKELVHFYNTRDVYRKDVDPGRCPAGTVEKVTCWPRAEVPQNQSHKLGNLGLTDREEDQLVAFLRTLTDGYTQPYPDKDVYSGACGSPAQPKRASLR